MRFLGPQISRDKLLGLGLAGLSLLMALGTASYFGVAGGDFPIAIFAWPALGFLLGLAIFLFGFVEAGLNVDDEIEQFPELIQDDLHNLRSGNFTPTHFFFGLTLAAIVIEFLTLFLFRKETASWGPVNVLIVALVVVVVTLALSLRARWFQRRKQRLQTRVYVIPAIGWLICILIGVSFAEPKEWGGTSSLERSRAASTEAYVVSSRTSYFFVDSSFELMDGIVSGLECDDEACLILLLIVVVAIVVLASATIPHFWVVGTMLLLTLMAVVTLRELLYREDHAIST